MRRQPTGRTEVWVEPPNGDPYPLKAYRCRLMARYHLSLLREKGVAAWLKPETRDLFD